MNHRRLCELLEECTWANEWLSKTVFGCAILEDKHIVLNLPLMIVEVAIHEMIHCEFPDKSEKWVERETYATLLRLSVAELVDLSGKVLAIIKAQEKEETGTKSEGYA